jgi:nitroreductase
VFLADLKSKALGADTEVVARLLNDRFSCRGFLPDAVPDADIERMFAVSQLSASWCNTQPWEVIVTTGEGTERFRKAALEHSEDLKVRKSDFALPTRYEGEYAARRRDAGWRLYESVGIERGDRKASFLQGQENYRLFGAPHLMILTSDGDLETYGAIDCGLYLGNLMLVAQSMGIATIAQAAFAFISPFVAEYFGLSPDRKVVCGMSFGYADPSHPANSFRTPRAPVDKVITWARD